MADSKKQYIQDLAQEDWESGHPFSSDDFRYFQKLCAEDGFDMTQEDWNYYWECFDDCKAAQYEEDIPVSDVMDRDINDAANWYKTSQIEGIMMSHQCSAEKAKEILGINPSYEYIPSGQLNENKKEKKMNSEKIFESILNERDEVQYPTTATFKSGKPKKIPTLLKYIFDNPGCTKKDAEAYLATLGLNRLPLESWPSLERTDMVEVIKQGSTNKYFPTKKLLTYLKSLNLIDNNADISNFNEIKNDAKEYKSGKVKQYQQDLYKKIIYVLNNDSPGEYEGWMNSNKFKNNLTNNQIIEVLNKVIDSLN